MLTVKEFKDLGVEFVAGDERSSSVKGHGDVHMSEDMAYGSNHEPKTDHESIISFAWRPLGTLPDNPKFKYEKAAMPFAKGDSYKKVWRPLLDQSKKSAYDVDAHVSGEELVIDQLKYDATKFSGIVQINNNEVKPVFTQAMADKGELPPVGSEAIFQCKEPEDFSGELRVGSVVKVIHHYSPCSDGDTVAVFVFATDRGSDVSQATQSCFKPLDIRTPKQKAVDEMLQIIDDQCSYRKACEIIYNMLVGEKC